MPPNLALFSLPSSGLGPVFKRASTAKPYVPLWRVVHDDHKGTDDRPCREDELDEPAAAARGGFEIMSLLNHVAPVRLLSATKRYELLNAAPRAFAGMTKVTLGKRKIAPWPARS
jgi:hypothetical protein